MSIDTILASLKASNEAGTKLSVEYLTNLALEQSANVEGNTSVTVLYSGLIGNNIYASDVARNMGNADGIAIIDNTDIGRLLKSDEFVEALDRAVDFNDGIFDSIYSGESITYDSDGNRIATRINNTSLWDQASNNFVRSATGDIKIIAPDADSLSVFMQTELPALMDNTNTGIISVNGIAIEDLRSAYANGDIYTVHASIKYSSIAEIATLSDSETGIIGKNGADIIKEHSEFGGIFHGWLDDIADSNLFSRSTLDAMGKAGDLIELGDVGYVVGNLLFDAAEAKAAGNDALASDLTDQAIGELSDWIVENVEGAIGAVLAVSALGLAVTAIGTLGVTVAVPGLLATGVTLAVGLAGGIAGEHLLDLKQTAKDMGLFGDDADANEGSTFMQYFKDLGKAAAEMAGAVEGVFFSIPERQVEYIADGQTVSHTFAEKSYQFVTDINGDLTVAEVSYTAPATTDIAQKAVDMFANGASGGPSDPSDPDLPTEFPEVKSVSIYNPELQKFEQFNAVDTAKIAKVAKSLGLGDESSTDAELVQQMFSGAGNSDWGLRDFVSDSLTKYVYKASETKVSDNIDEFLESYKERTGTDYKDYAYYDQDADNPEFDYFYTKGQIDGNTYEYERIESLNFSIERAKTHWNGKWVNIESPLVLDLNGDGMSLVAAYNQDNVIVHFDIDNDGFAERVGWVAPEDGMLAMDNNGNGNIDDITELYGDDEMPAFDKLRLHDTNGDGKINSDDADFNNFLVWRDLNQNGISEEGELKTLAETGIKEISLTETKEDYWLEENYISGKSSFKWNNDTTGEIADVHFLNDNANTWFKGAHSQVYGSDVKINFEALVLPLSRGYGSLPSLHIAMSHNAELMQMVKNVVNLAPEDFGNLSDMITDILYEWAGVRFNDPDARRTGNGSNIDARKVDFLEKFTGVEWKQMGVADFVGSKASLIVKKSWNEISEMMTSRILIQGTFEHIFPDAVYFFQHDAIQLNSSMNEIISLSSDYITGNPENAHEFWLKIANILIAHQAELAVSVADINNAVSTAFGSELFIADKIITVSDEDVYTRADGKNEHLLVNTRIGDANDNLIHGSQSNDYIFADAGNDTVYGNGGDDFIRGDGGSDVMYGGDGDDRIEGSDDADVLDGGAGRDDLRGGAGADTLLGGEGSDKLHGGAGADVIDGGAGVDEIDYLESATGVYVNLERGVSYGGDAAGDVFTNIENITGSDMSDVLIGDSNDNIINGEAGNDYIEGGEGNDWLFGAYGADSLYGGKGDDIVQGFDGAEYLDGGEGVDRADYSHSYNTEGVYVNLSLGKGSWNSAKGDVYVNIENIAGTDNEDLLIGDAGDNSIWGRDGFDIIDGGAGNDILYGGNGDAILTGGTGTDIFVVGDDANAKTYITDFDVTKDEIHYDFISGNEGKTVSAVANGNDTILHIDSRYFVILKNIQPSQLTASNFLFGDSGLTAVSTGPSADIGVHYTGDEYGNYLNGFLGDDVIDGGLGDDKIQGGFGNDSLMGGAGNDHIYGGEGADTLDGGAGIDAVYYEKSYEGVNVNLGTGEVSGGYANGDVISNFEGVKGSFFDDVLIGNSSNNTLVGSGGADILNGKGGNNILEGGFDDDTFVIEVNSGSLTTISDFEAGNPNEKIDLTAFGNISEIKIFGNADGNTIITLNDNQYVVLEGVHWGYMDILESGSPFTFADGVNPTFITTKETHVGNVRLGTNQDDTLGYIPGTSQTFIDGEGNDTMYGAPESNGQFYPDIFHITYNTGDVDTIHNFDSYVRNIYWQDISVQPGLHNSGDRLQSSPSYSKKIDLSGFVDILGFDDLSISTPGTDTHISIGNGQTIILKNYTHEVDDNVQYNEITDGVEQNHIYIGSRYVFGSILVNTYETIARHFELTSSSFTFYNGTLNGTFLEDILDGGKGSDTIYGNDGDDIIDGKGANDYLYGGGGDDILTGGDGSDNLYGGTGDDTLKGQSGNDSLTGGDGADIFIIEADGSNDTIIDFEAWNGREKIDLSAFNSQITNFASFKANHISQDGNVAVININGQTIRLQNVDSNLLTRDNFIGDASINTAPNVSGSITIAEPAHLLEEWSYTVDSGIFTDSDGDWLNIIAVLDNGNDSPLPAWLSFDSKTLTFSGTPQISDTGDLKIKLIASDGSESASISFDLQVAGLLYGTNFGQEVSYIEDTDFLFGKPISITSMTETTATISITLSDTGAGVLSTGTSGSVISTFVNGVWTASGNIAAVNVLLSNMVFIPADNYNGDFSIDIHIEDGVNTPVDKTISATGIAVNDSPTSSSNIINVNGQEDTTLIINPADVIDVEDGTIQFNPTNVVFGGVSNGVTITVNVDGTFTYIPRPDYNGTDSFTYKVKDSNGEFSNPITVNVNIAGENDAPVLTGSVPDQQGREEGYFSYTLPSNLFVDPEDDMVAVSITLANGDSRPDWLEYNDQTGELYGTPPRGSKGTVNLKVTADDGNGGTSATAFKININTGDAYFGDTINGTEPWVAPVPTWHDIDSRNADSFIIVDYNHDGINDVVADLGTEGVELYDPTSGIWQELFDNNADSIKTSELNQDFNDDGYKDFLTDLNINGLWSISPTGNQQLIINDVDQFWIKDFNNDGSQDIVLDVGDLGLYLYKRSGTYSQLSNGNAISLQLEDYDNDGKVDIIANFENTGLNYINNNLTTFKQIYIDYNGQQTPIHPTQYEVADIFAGGNKEIIFSFNDYIYIDNGSAVAQRIDYKDNIGSINVTNFIEFGVVDLDGDTDLDIMAVYNGGHVIFYNNGSGFDSGGISTSVPLKMQFADWNNDGKAEIFANRVGFGLSVKDSITKSWTTLSDKIAESYEIKDITADGNLDVIADFGADGMKVYDRFYQYNGADNLTGTAKDDVISGLGGNDTISGGDGWDELHGGYGDDIIYGNEGNDILYDGYGHDHLFGGNGADRFVLDGIEYNSSMTETTPGIFDFNGGYNAVIYDFDSTVVGEQIDLTAYEHIVSFDQINFFAWDIGGVASTLMTISDAGNTGTLSSILLYGYDNTNSTLSTNDFIFYNNTLAPQVANHVPDVNMGLGQAYSYTVPEDAFIDPEGRDVTYSVVASQIPEGGNVDWITFDQETGILSGTPQTGDTGHYIFQLQASDGLLVGVDEFNITVSPTLFVNHANQFVTYTEDSELDFTDIHVSTAAGLVTITLTISNVNAGTLTTPSSNGVNSIYDDVSGVWTVTGSSLDVNTILADLKFNPASNYNGGFTIAVNVNDGFNTAINDAITVAGVAVNDAPMAAGIAYQNATEGSIFTFTVPADSFTDIDGHTLTYTARNGDGTALPSWLKFNGNSFSGTPANDDVGDLSVKVIANDGHGGTAETIFNIAIANINDAPNSIGTIANSSVDQGESKIIVDASIVQAAFTDIDANDTLTYSLTVNGGNAPEWIRIDSTTGQITSDNPGNNDVGSYNLTVTVTDTSLASASQNFAINVLNINDAPTDILLNNTMIDENIASGAIGDLRVADIDIYDHHTFSIDDNRFEIVSGQLKLVDGVALDFEAEESVTINVTATDSGGLKIVQQFVINVNDVINHLTGTAGSETINGTSEQDIIDGGASTDWLYGNAGNDTILGGDGWDYLYGGAGADVLDGGTGSDVAVFTDLTNSIKLDLLTGHHEGAGIAGDTFISIERFWGSNHNDIMIGSNGNDELHGSGGEDTIYGNGGNDLLKGNTGNDWLYGGDGNDSLFGSEGNDYLYGGFGSDSIDGGSGWDVASFTDLANGITLDLATGNHIGTGIEGDSFTNIDSYWGSNFNDVMIGDSLGNYLDGSVGNDTISGNGGNDYLKGNTGDDLIAGGIGNDTLYGNEGNDTVYGDAGDDFLTGWNGNDVLYGGDGNDSIYGHEDDDILNGGAGADILNGGSGSDTFIISASAIDDSTTITDFNGGDGDIIDLTSIYNNSISFIQLTLQMSQENNDVVIGLSYGGILILQNTYLGDLHSGNFIGLAADLIDFDTDYYLLRNPDVVDAITAGNFESAYQHYALAGAIEGREPNGDAYGLVRSADFDAGYYLITNPDVADAITTGIFESAYQHYVSVGATEGREPNGDSYGLVRSADFDAGYYLITNPDVADAITTGVFESAYQHYISVGATEGREPNGDLYIIGDDLNNVLSGSHGNDTIEGGVGNDILYGGAGSDAINGGSGWDVASFTDLTNCVTLDLATGNHLGAGIAGDKFTSIESYWGSNFDDVMIGSAGNNNFDGSGGNDTILGNDGNDNLRGNIGDDLIAGGLGADTLTGGADADTFNFDNIADSTTSVFDTIVDFVIGEDVIDFSGLADEGITSFSDLTIAVNGSHTDISAAGTDLHIELTGILGLDQNDFVF